MFGLCKYRNIFGRPGKGLHRFRIFNIPVVDVALTFLLAKIIQKLLFPRHHYGVILFFCFILGIILHRVFCVKTPIDQFLFS